MESFKWVCFISIIVVFFGCTSKAVDSDKNQATVTSYPTKTIVMENLKRPWSMAFLSKEEALLAEKDGDLLLLNLKSKTKQIISGFPADLADSLLIKENNYPKGTYPRGSDGFKGKYNAGIFDIVLDPDYRDNKWVYISYVSEEDQKYATKVIRTKIDNNKLTQIEQLLLVLPYSDGLFHFGGGMLFGDDEKLYITAGERLFGDSLQPILPIAQNYKDRRGKIYCINSDGSIPDDNPVFEEEAIEGVYALGIRAAQGLTKDPRNGRIWFSEHGTTQGDELNLLDAGANYGWPIKSTGGYRGGYKPPNLAREYTDPMWSWYKTIAPTGLTFYTGKQFPRWKNNLIVPGLSKGNFWRLVIEDKTILSVEELFINNRHRTRKAVQGLDGELYILTDEENGKIIRIDNSSQLPQ